MWGAQRERRRERTWGPCLHPEGLYTRKLYYIKGRLSRDEVESIARDLLANDLIQTRTVFAAGDDRSAIAIPKLRLTLTRWCGRSISRSATTSCSASVAKVSWRSAWKKCRQFGIIIKIRFPLAKRGTCPGREITDCELEVLAQTWSEHCKHKRY